MTKLKTDWILFLTILAMTGLGIVMVYSASSGASAADSANAAVKAATAAEIKGTAPERPREEAPYSAAVRQIIFAAGSFLALMFFKRMDYRRLNTPTVAFSGLGIVLGLLVLVYFADPVQHRWFRVKGIGQLQPSEFAKPALILFLAYFISRRSQILNSRKTLQQAVLAIAMLGFLVVLADLGTALVPVVVAIAVLWVAGLESKYMIRVGLAGVVLVALALVHRPYRLLRFLNFIDPDYKTIETVDTTHWVRIHVEAYYASHPNIPRDPAYQPKQAKIAVGTGGALGVGLMQGKQKLQFLPEAHTDYIYATIGEELGLWGATSVLVGYIVILWRGARLFLVASEEFGKYLALGVTLTILLQAFINISVVLGMGPTKGFPLPLISFGGSSLLSTLVCLGMLLSVGEHEG
jgi:cell division protein FtsW